MSEPQQSPIRKPDKKEIRKEIYNRSLFLYYIFFSLSLIVVGNILYTQYGPHGDELREEAKNEKTFLFKTTYAKRGDIFSHNDRLLSTSVPNYYIYMDFKAEGLADSVFTKNVDGLAGSLAGFFKDKPAKAYSDSLKRWHKAGLRYKRISPRRINYLELKTVLKFPLYNLGRNRGGFMLDTLNKRFMPNGSLARRTIGRVNDADGTKYGIEGFFDKELRGVNGMTATQKISGNFWMPVKNEANVAPVDGFDVVSTLDIEVQRVAEDALRTQLQTHEAEWGSAILMEVETGEIRAIANLSRNKEKPDEYFEDMNHAVGKNMEPGSTFKLVTLMALLDDAHASINEMVNTEGGTVMIGRAKVVDTKRGGYGTISLQRCFEVSSNICFGKIINKYYSARPSQFIDYLKGLGMEDPLLATQVAGEQMPLIRRPGERYWDGTTLTMMSYGYAVMLTPLRTLTLYNAIANNGRMVKPRLVTEVRKKGIAVKTFPREVIKESICSPTTLKHIKTSMEGVVNEGTARNILLNNNYKVAGKTGTAQVAKGRFGYTVNGGKYYLATVVGYFPADKPKYSCIVAIETFRPEGSGKTYYGGSLSGPVFRAIADKVYSLSPTWANEISKPETNRPNPVKQLPKIHTAPSVKQGDETFVQSAASRFNIPVTPQPEVPDSLKDKMPNVMGMALRDAVYVLEKEGFVVIINGKGEVKEQSKPPGAEFNPGDTVVIHLK